MLSAYVEVSPVKFAKMQGNGNDFIILDNREEKLSQGKIQTIAIKLCRRRLSIGADGLIVLDAPTNSNSSFQHAAFKQGWLRKPLFRQRC